MGIDHPPRNKHGRLGEPSLRADETTDDAISLLNENALREDEPALWGDEHTDDALSLLGENALPEDEPSFWGDEHADDVQSLLEENARLRRLLVQLSDLIQRNVVHSR